jgi:hypothetical protein
MLGRVLAKRAESVQQPVEIAVMLFAIGTATARKTDRCL